MPEYQMNDAVIDLPAHFNDKTFHIFTVENAGASAFTFVVSRAPMESGDTVDTFVDRLVSEMRKTLPHFQLKQLQTREVDGETAREIDYQWISDNAPLHQRQTVVMSPTRSDKPQAISFIGTCPRVFTPEWTKEYAKLVDSVALKRTQPTSFTSLPLDASTNGVVFVLHESNAILYALSGIKELFRHDIREMFEGVSFYGATGAPLSLQPAPGAQQGWRGSNGQSFLLWTLDPQQHGSLVDRLGDINAFRGMSSLATADAVRAYLASVAELRQPIPGESA